jgi:hypothetical protein
MKIINNTYTLPPAWKRKHAIIFRASFQPNINLEKDLKDSLAMVMWKMWFFN